MVCNFAIYFTFKANPTYILRVMILVANVSMNRLAHYRLNLLVNNLYYNNNNQEDGREYRINICKIYCYTDIEDREQRPGVKG